MADETEEKVKDYQQNADDITKKDEPKPTSDEPSPRNVPSGTPPRELKFG